jgi:hypothetical protein
VTGGRIPRTALIACALILACALPTGAAAKRGLTAGFAGIDPYQSTDAAVRSSGFDRTVDAGAGIVRFSVGWAYVAPQRPLDPTNPASYDPNLASLDAAVRDAAARGLKTLITVNVAPPWAEGAGRPTAKYIGEGSWKPNPSDLADFDQAIAARYSGSFDPDGIGPQQPLPAVDALEVWNEPNSTNWLSPQFEGKTPVGPELYRDMLNASYKSIKSVNPRMQVVAAGTNPYGDPPGGPYPPDVQRVQPVQFWQQLLCLSPKKRKKKGKKNSAATRFVRSRNCAGQAMFDVLAHHPIDNTGGGPLRHGPRAGDASTPDLGRIVSVLRAAERLGTVSGRHPVWVTEFWWDSKPPNPAGAPLLTQARWIEQSLYLFWKAGASVAINFEFQDINARPDVHAGFQSGVYFQDGRPKPSLTAFKFPFVTERINGSKLRAWGKAPEPGKLKIQRRQGARWVTVKRLQVGKGDVFDTTLKLSGKQQLRATVGSSQSVVWRQAAAGANKSSGGGPSPALVVLLLAGGVVLVIGGTAAVRRRQLQRHRRPRPVTG